MFAPLALTQALPYLPLAQGSIDYQVERRADPGLIDRTLRAAGARVVLTRNGLLAVPLGQRNAAAQPNARMRLATLPGAYVASALASHPHVVAMYLGEYAGAHPERIVALDISAVDAVPPAGRAVDAAFDERGTLLADRLCSNRPCSASTGLTCARSCRARRAATSAWPPPCSHSPTGSPTKRTARRAARRHGPR